MTLLEELEVLSQIDALERRGQELQERLNGLTEKLDTFLAGAKAGMKPVLCDDEGCPHFGMPHYCLKTEKPCAPSGQE